MPKNIVTYQSRRAPQLGHPTLAGQVKLCQRNIVLWYPWNKYKMVIGGGQGQGGSGWFSLPIASIQEKLE